MKKIQTPISDDVVNDLKVGDKISLSGLMYCGRDAVLPKLAKSIENDDTDKYPFDFKGMAIMHTAFSVAGVAPTTSNKTEIESSIPTLSKAGVTARTVIVLPHVPQLYSTPPTFLDVCVAIRIKNKMGEMANNA